MTDPRGAGNGPAAGRFVLLGRVEEAGMAAPEWGYVTSWDTWEEAAVAFPIAAGFQLQDGETGREWPAHSRYEWEAART